MTQIHSIPPLFDPSSRVLILGSFPSVKSRETGFFYGHTQNRFWRVLSEVLNCAEPRSVEEKKRLLLSHGVALWDVIRSCDIEGSADSSIKNIVPNDLSVILESCDIKSIFVNGKTAERLYIKYIQPKVNRPAVCLPSTSPANASWSVSRLTEAWLPVRHSLTLSG